MAQDKRALRREHTLYCPEANSLVPLSCQDELSKTPACKGLPVRIRT